jgi:methylmalonyl-CoA epimerase
VKIDHLGIATHQLNDAIGFWCEALGLPIDSQEDLPDQGVKVAMLSIGDAHIELLEPLSTTSPVGKFLQKRGPGIHHVAVRVTDIQEALAQLKKSGAQLIDEVPRPGARGCLVAFVHPVSVNGVLLELVQRQ